MNTIYQLNDDILLSIECPACYDPMKRPIFLCIEGHSLCGACRYRLTKCPVCYGKILEARNWMIESLTDILFYPCPNEDQGCLEKYRLQELEKHSNVCSYRIYSCMIRDNGDVCAFRARKAELSSHVQSIHADKAWIKSESLIRWTKTKPKFEIQMISDFDEIFWFYRKEKENLLYWTVQYIGKTDQARKFNFEIIVSNEDNPERHLTFGAVCQSDILTIEDLFKYNRCAVFSLNVFQMFMDRNESVWYKVVITHNDQESTKSEEEEVEEEGVEDADYIEEVEDSDNGAHDG